MSDKEFEVITAAEEAEGCLSQSITVLYDFFNRWFCDNTPKEHTILDITHRYDLLQAHLCMIINGLESAKEKIACIIDMGVINQDAQKI